MHLTPDELVDLAEGAGTESTAGHVRSCAMCEQQVAELRAALSAAASVEVPEPSPLFWQHLAARVREAVAADERQASRWRPGSWRVWRSGAFSPALALGAVALFALLVTATRPPTRVAPAVQVAPTAQALALQPFGSPDDPSLAIVAGLAEEMDADAMREASATSRIGGADEVVTELTDDERTELQRLLKEALAL